MSYRELQDLCWTNGQSVSYSKYMWLPVFPSAALPSSPQYVCGKPAMQSWDSEQTRPDKLIIIIKIYSDGHVGLGWKYSVQSIDKSPVPIRESEEQHYTLASTHTHTQTLSLVSDFPLRQFCIFTHLHVSLPHTQAHTHPAVPLAFAVGGKKKMLKWWK